MGLQRPTWWGRPLEGGSSAPDAGTDDGQGTGDKNREEGRDEQHDERSLGPGRCSPRSVLVLAEQEDQGAEEGEDCCDLEDREDDRRDAPDRASDRLCRTEVRAVRQRRDVSSHGGLRNCDDEQRKGDEGDHHDGRPLPPDLGTDHEELTFCRTRCPAD